MSMDSVEFIDLWDMNWYETSADMDILEILFLELDMNMSMDSVEFIDLWDIN